MFVLFAFFSGIYLFISLIFNFCFIFIFCFYFYKIMQVKETRRITRQMLSRPLKAKRQEKPKPKDQNLAQPDFALWRPP